MNFANLHCHTHWSDGMTSPGDLVQQAAACPGLGVLALSDHDTLSGIEPCFRALAGLPPDKRIRLVVAVELSTYFKPLKEIVHILGYWPGINQGNLSGSLQRLDSVLGDHFRRTCRGRIERDVKARVRKAHELNLDQAAEHYASAEDMIRPLVAAYEKSLEQYFQRDAKAGDVIDYPRPASYQLIMNHWSELLPRAVPERINWYILRPSSARRELLARSFMEKDGLPADQAEKLADELQGVLLKGLPEPDYPSPVEGVKMLKEAGALVFVAHPAVDLHKVSYEDFDARILEPMLAAGMEGIEVYYPYDPKYRDQAISHYGGIAAGRGLLISGGTDFHGDGRSTLDEVRTPLERLGWLRG